MQKTIDTIEQFISKLETEFEITPGSLKSDTSFRDLDDWSSMHALIIIALIDTEYDVTITGDDLKNIDTVQDLYKIVISRKKS